LNDIDIAFHAAISCRRRRQYAAPPAALYCRDAAMFCHDAPSDARRARFMMPVSSAMRHYFGAAVFAVSMRCCAALSPYADYFRRDIMLYAMLRHFFRRH